MTATSAVPVTTASLEVPGARLYYEVRGQGPLVALVGAPMDAGPFAPLAELLAVDHTVLTTDPRGINRSPVDDRDCDVDPAQRADDLSRLLSHLGRDAEAVFGSSGGAVTALALAEAHPSQVGVVIAHEPPLEELVDDRDELRAKTEDMIATFLAGDRRGAWAKFLDTANIRLPDQVFEAMFGGEPEPQAAADQHFQFAHMLRGTTRWQPDFAVLRAGATRVVVGIGEESGGQLCDRTSRALAAGLGVAPTFFPGDHTGFAGDPERFAGRLRAVLSR
jgi:pimeloyl-ACP methyl ester carboxylesterase